MDSNADCTRMLVDGWLELGLTDGDSALKVLSSALSLRGEWERLLQAQIGQGVLGSSAGPKVSRRELDKLCEGLVRFLLYTEVTRQT